jgi:hypothetical protein
MISTIKKMPWYLPDQITVRQRNAIHAATKQLVRLLDIAIRDEREPQLLTRQLKKRLVDAVLSCPGISVIQKDDLAWMDNRQDAELIRYGQPRGAHWWTHQFTICPKVDAPADVVEVSCYQLPTPVNPYLLHMKANKPCQWYIAIIRENTNAIVNSLPKMQGNDIITLGEKTSGYWGFFWWELQLPDGPTFDGYNLRQVAVMEMNAIEKIIRRALTPTPQQYI